MKTRQTSINDTFLSYRYPAKIVPDAVCSTTTLSLIFLKKLKGSHTALRTRICTHHIDQYYYRSPAHQLRRSQKTVSVPEQAKRRSELPPEESVPLAPASRKRRARHAQLEDALSGHTATTSATPGLYVGL